MWSNFTSIRVTTLINSRDHKKNCLKNIYFEMFSKAAIRQTIISKQKLKSEIYIHFSDQEHIHHPAKNKKIHVNRVHCISLKTRRHRDRTMRRCPFCGSPNQPKKLKCPRFSRHVVLPASKPVLLEETFICSNLCFTIVKHDALFKHEQGNCFLNFSILSRLTRNMAIR